MPSPESREDWIVGEALKRLPAERAPFLDGACAGDAALRQRVDSLLPTPKPEADSLSPTVVDSDCIAQIEELAAEEGTGTLIGRYRLLEKIGEGGFGVVYVAEQKEPVKRRIALKIIKLGMDTRQVVARFESERQALALMDHPNIAKVLDGGATADGRPYFAMELVHGIPITEHCDQNKLSTERRLNLFTQVCQAIQHAHQKGIIHRDIKPSNILVTVNDGLAVPKVIDFGIAKATAGQALTDKTVYTQLQQFIGTPAYMSPEQAEMSAQDIDTRSDIYSLGVLLYELLVGRTPFDAKELLQSGLDQMRRTIREKEPVRPSTRVGNLPEAERTTVAKGRAAEAPRLINLLRGDLDWIVMRCLEKDRTRRYDTANGLAMDVQRYLRNEPVMARPPNSAYKVRKFVQRNRVGVMAGAAVAGMLVLGLLASTLETIRARRAEAEQARLRQAAQAAQAQETRERQRAEAQELIARQRAYASDMAVAQQELAAENLGLVRALLDRQRPQPGQTDLRGWEWRYLWGGSRSDDEFALRGHSNEVAVTMFLPDGRTAFSAGADDTLRFWDLERRCAVETIPYPDNPLSAALSTDGHLLAICGAFGSWSLLDVQARHIVMTRTNASVLRGAAFSSNGLLALAGEQNIEIWDVKSRCQIKTFPRRGNGEADASFVVGLAFTPDGRKLAYGHAGHRIVLQDLDSDTECVLGTVAAGQANSLAFSPDGQTLVSGDSLHLSVWDVSGRNPPLHLPQHREQIVCVAFSPDGSLVASASGDQTVRLWDARTWQLVTTLHGHEHEVHSVGFSPDGKKLISGGKDKTVRVWNVSRRAEARSVFPIPDEWRCDPDRPSQDRILMISGDWNAAGFLDLATLEHSGSQAQPPGLPSWMTHNNNDGLTLGPYMAVNRSGSLAVIAHADRTVELWQTGPFSKLKVVADSKGGVTDMALSESGRWLALQREDGTTELWELERNQLVERFGSMQPPVGGGFCRALSFWAGDRLLVRMSPAANNIDSSLELISVPHGPRHRVYSTHTGIDALNNFAISEDGTLVATAGFDGTVRLRETSTGRELDSITGQLIGFHGLAFSPDGSRLATGGYDGSILLWDLRSHQRLCSWKAHVRDCFMLSFLRDSKGLVSFGQATQLADKSEIRVWRAPSWEEIGAAEAAKQNADPPSR